MEPLVLLVELVVPVDVKAPALAHVAQTVVESAKMLALETAQVHAQGDVMEHVQELVDQDVAANVKALALETARASALEGVMLHAQGLVDQDAQGAVKMLVQVVVVVAEGVLEIVLHNVLVIVMHIAHKLHL